MSSSITNGFVSVLATKLLVLAIGIATSPLLATLLGEGDYGDYSFLLSVFSIFMIFVSSGVTEGVQKFLGEERRDDAWTDRVVGFYFRLAVVLGIAGAGGMLWFADSNLLARLVDSAKFRRYFYLLGGLVVAAQFRSYARRTLMGFGLEPYSETLKVVHRLTFVSTGLALAALGYGVEGVLVGHIVGSAVPAFAGLALVAGRVSVLEALRPAPRSFPRAELLSFNGLSVVLVALLMSLYHVDVMMIRVLVDGPSTAFYKVALVLAEFLWVVPTSLQMVLLHSTSSLWSKGDTERISTMTARLTRYSLLFTSLLAVGIASLAPTAVPLLWPDEYVASLAPLYLLLPGAVGFAIARPILAVGQAKGDLRRPILATGAAAVANVGLNWVLIGRFGILGAAAATSLSYGSMFLLHVWSARGLGFDPLADARLVRVGITVAVGGSLVFAISRAVPGSYLALAVVPVAGSFVFLSVALISRALDLSELLEVLKPLPVVGSRAASLQRRLAYGTRADAVETFHRLLLVAGTVLLVLAVGVAVTGSGVGLPALGDDDRDSSSPAITTVEPATDRTTQATAEEPTSATTATATTTETPTATTSEGSPTETTAEESTTEESTTEEADATEPPGEEPPEDEPTTTEEPTTEETTTETTTEETTTTTTTTEEPTTTETTTTETTTTTATTTEETTTEETTTEETTTEETTTEETTTEETPTTTEETTAETTTEETTTETTEEPTMTETTTEETTTMTETTTEETTTTETTETTTEETNATITLFGDAGSRIIAAIRTDL